MAIFGFGRSKQSKTKDSPISKSTPVPLRSNPAALIPVSSNPAANLIQEITFSHSPFAPASPALESTGLSLKVTEKDGDLSGTAKDDGGDELRKRDEEEKLGRASLSIEDATELVSLCSVQIRERGESPCTASISRNVLTE